MVGKTLGHYQITSQLGKGGMGEVYQAKDQVLGRDVAIKVLPEEFAKDAERVARFQREAKVLASLNHPNIAAIHGLERSNGTNFLVLELVEGQTLADRIKAGPIPVEESLKLALQIAEALEAAHEKGVIHRDLKPANIKVTPDGKVKVLDFGLAKAFAGDQAELNLSNSPTLSDMATQKGVILGTAAYMSPEQAKGKAVDKRTDIWAFGCVLYETLTGQAAFQGEDVTEILAAVVKLGANLDLLPSNLHYRVREVITRCLQRDLNRRYQDIRDARYEIEQAVADPSGVFVQPATTMEPRTRLRTMLPWIAAAIILGALVAGAAIWQLRIQEPPPVTRFYYELPDGRRFNHPSGQVVGISPDSRQLVYSTSEGLYLRSMDELDARLIAGTANEDPGEPLFSPDGKWIVYYSLASKQLKKIATGGGIPITLCDIPTFRGSNWGIDNTIIYGEGVGNIMRVSANGGTPELLFKKEGENCGRPQILPGGKSVLYSRFDRQPNGNIVSHVMIRSLETGKVKELFGGYIARYLNTGHIVYSTGNKLLETRGDLFAVPFDLTKLEVTGGAVSLINDISGFLGVRYAISDSGTLVYIPGITVDFISFGDPAWVDFKGQEMPIEAKPNIYSYPKISPDGTKVALAVMDLGSAKTDIWILDLLRKILTRLTFYESSNTMPLWTPDGQRIVFASDRDGGNYGIYCKAADGTGKDEKLASMPDRSLFPCSLSRDGKTLAMAVAEGSSNLSLKWDVGILSMDGDHAQKALLQQDYVEIQPQISPDRRWIAYSSNESGQFEVYVRPFPEVDNGKWQVSTSGGSSPRWAPHGRELFYLASEDSIVAISVQAEPTFSFGTPRHLFKNIYKRAEDLFGISWDISPDGKRFLMLKEAADTGKPAAETPRKINIVLNWFEELKQRVPTHVQ